MRAGFDSLARNKDETIVTNKNINNNAKNQISYHRPAVRGRTGGMVDGLTGPVPMSSLDKSLRRSLTY